MSTGLPSGPVATPSTGDSFASTRFYHAELARKENKVDLDFEDPFWVYSSTIESSRWNKSYPYQLLVVEALPSDQALLNPDAEIRSIAYRVRQEWKFTLPIPPSDLRLSMPFAITTEVLNGGIVEEHNGAPLRMISFSGTTGVLPLRGSVEQLQSFNAAQAIFAGTIKSANSAISAAGDLLGEPKDRPNVLSKSDTDDGTDGGKATGYHQFRLLQQFFESYAAVKKTISGKNLRLALAMWKDQAVYLVTPINFEVGRTNSSPLEYPYQLNFKAWKRIQLNAAEPAASAYKPAVRDPNAFTNILNKIEDARRVLQAASDVIGSVVGDLDTVLEPLREVTLFCKDALGVEQSAADLPGNIISELKQPVLDVLTLKSQAGAAQDIFKGSSATTAAALSGFKATLSDLAGTEYQFGSNSPKTQQAVTTTGQLKPTIQFQGAHPGHAIFAQPQKFFDLFSAIKPASLRLSPGLVQKIKAERARVRQLKRLDFETMRDNLVQRTADYADAVGAGDATFNKIYGRPPPPATTRVPSTDDFNVMFALNQAVSQLNRLAASGLVDKPEMTSIEYIAALAGRSGMQFKLPQSKVAVPFPYGITLERLAARHLGNPDRWIEIATLNNLRAPYVDEVGFDLPLQVNGSGNQTVVTDASNIYVGQPVWISSTTTARSKRRIKRIDVIVPGTVVVTLDGDPDLAKYTTMAQSSIHAYLPNTVNSQQMVFIPSTDTPADQDFKNKAIPGIDHFDNLIAVGGADLLLTSTGDLAVTPDGDCRFAVGLTNLVQRIRIAYSISRGSLLRHPGFGLNVRPGTSTADLSAAELLSASRDLFRNDPAFTGVIAASILKSGPVATQAVQVGIAGSDQPIAVSLDVQQQ